MHNVPRETPTCYDFVKLLRLKQLTSMLHMGGLLSWQLTILAQQVGHPDPGKQILGRVCAVFSSQAMVGGVRQEDFSRSGALAALARVN